MRCPTSGLKTSAMHVNTLDLSLKCSMMCPGLALTLGTRIHTAQGREGGKEGGPRMTPRKGKTIRDRLQTNDYQGLCGEVGKEGGYKLTTREYSIFCLDGSYSTIFACQYS